MRLPHRRASISARKPRLRSWLAAALFLIGCQVISGVDDLTVVPGSSSSAGSPDGTPGAGSGGTTGASGDTAQPGGDGSISSDCGLDGTRNCPDNKLCRAGVCIDPLEDKDGDGIPSGSDCDDNDEN